MDNPFRIGERVSGAYFTDRVEEVNRIHRAMRDPSRLLVYGPRRMGKSSTIQVAADRFSQDGGIPVRADLGGATGTTEVGIIDDLTAGDGPFHGAFERLHVAEMPRDHFARWIGDRPPQARHPGPRPGRGGLRGSLLRRLGPEGATPGGVRVGFHLTATFRSCFRSWARWTGATEPADREC